MLINRTNFINLGRVFITIILTALFALSIFGQNGSRVSAVNIKSTAVAPKIDGILSDEEWKSAVRIELANQAEPQEFSPASERTEVFLSFDKEHLYVAFHCFDREVSAIRAPVSKRDDVQKDDHVALWLDTFDDRRRSYVFRFNPLGIQEDGIYTPSDINNLTWDGIIESKGVLTSDGYTIEAKIPFKTLRFQINKEKSWGLHAFRWIARKQERTSWQPISRNVADLLEQMGSMNGLDGIFGGRTLDIIPTLVTSATGTREADPSVPTGARLNNVNKVEPGLTATYTITPNLTLSATVNPDFSQVEADIPQVSVNQRFALFFPERRPFFLEGGEVFRPVYGAGLRVIDTRQIVDPDWGIKLTGKIGKNTIGILSASDNATGLRLPQTDTNFGKNASFNIFRYQRDVLKQSTIGGSFTDYRFAGSSNQVATADGRLRFGNHLIAYQLAYSKTEDINGTKREGAATYAAYVFTNRKWDFTLTDSHIARNFRALTGFIRRTGYDRQFLNAGYSFRPKEKTWWTKFRPFVATVVLLNEQKKLDETFFDPGIDLVFDRGISVYTYFSTRRDNFLGRGYTTRAYIANTNFDTFKKVRFSAEIEIGTGVNFNPLRPEIGNLLNGEFSVRLQPVTKINSEFLWLKSSLKSRTNGESLFKQDILRNRTVYQFNRFNSVRSIIEYDTSLRRLGLSFLYAYTPKPNTAIYVGYNDLLFNGLDPLTNTRQSGLFRQNRTAFVKLSYNFRF